MAGLNVVVVDLETTGKYPTSDTITEIAAARRPAEWFTTASRAERTAESPTGVGSASDVETFTTLVNPGCPIPPLVQELTGITDDMVSTAPPLREVLPELLAFTEGCLIVAHNAHFDLSFVAAACRTLALKTKPTVYLDTLKVSRKVLGKAIANHRLATLADYYEVSEQPTHRALADVSATEQVLRGLLATAHTTEHGDDEGLFPSQPSWQVLAPFLQQLPDLTDILNTSKTSSPRSGQRQPTRR